MFRASLCPSSGEQDRDYCIWCSALVVWSWDVSCVHCVKVTVRLSSNLRTVHTAYDTAPHNHSHYNQCRTPHAVIHGLALLMMGIMMPETCWDKILIINIGLVASCFISLHNTFHDAWSQESKTCLSIALQLSERLFLYLMVPGTHFLVLLIRVKLRWCWVQNIGEILRGKPMCLEKSMSISNFFHPESHIDRGERDTFCITQEKK